MTTQDFKRKLTAIFSADVEGYSRLMGEDEEATVRTITTYRDKPSIAVLPFNNLSGDPYIVWDCPMV